MKTTLLTIIFCLPLMNCGSAEEVADELMRKINSEGQEAETTGLEPNESNWRAFSGKPFFIAENQTLTYYSDWFDEFEFVNAKMMIDFHMMNPHDVYLDFQLLCTNGIGDFIPLYYADLVINPNDFRNVHVAAYITDDKVRTCKKFIVVGRFDRLYDFQDTRIDKVYGLVVWE